MAATLAEVTRRGAVFLGVGPKRVRGLSVQSEAPTP
jgi:hypothetical protein